MIGGLDAKRNGLSGFQGIDNTIYPQTGGSIVRRRLIVISCLDFLVQRFLLLRSGRMALAFERFDLDLGGQPNGLYLIEVRSGDVRLQQRVMVAR